MNARLKEIQEDAAFEDEREALRAYAELLKKQDATKAKRKASEEALHAKIDGKYPKHTEKEVQALIIEDKWLAHLERTLGALLSNAALGLARRIEQLASRYDSTLPDVAASEGTHSVGLMGHAIRVVEHGENGSALAKWPLRALGDFAGFQAGIYLPQSSYKRGRYRVHGAGAVMGRHDEASHPDPLTVVGRVGTIGRPRFEPSGCWVNNNAGALVADRSLCEPEYLQLLLERVDWSSVVAVTAQSFLKVNDLLAHGFVLPSLDEQRRIIEVTQAAQQAVASLEKKLAKCRDVEVGIKQFLLTGKTRLLPVGGGNG